MRNLRRAGVTGIFAAVVLVGVAFAVPAVLGRGVDTKGAAVAKSQGWHGQVQSASHARGGFKFVYVRGSATVQPGAFHGGTITCPRRFPHPVSGFFDSDSEKLVLTTDRPHPSNAGPRRVRTWALGTTNLDAVPANVTVGVVCTK
jgi:hypothetical protein